MTDDAYVAMLRKEVADDIVWIYYAHKGWGLGFDETHAETERQAAKIPAETLVSFQDPNGYGYGLDTDEWLEWRKEFRKTIAPMLLHRHKNGLRGQPHNFTEYENDTEMV